MDFNFSDEQNLLRDTVKRMVAEKIAPAAIENDVEGKVAIDSIKLLGDHELLGLVVPEKYGGAGLDYVTYVMVNEEISRGDISTTTILFTHTLGLTPILNFGSEEQKEKYLPPLAKGEKLTAFGLTEPSSGSDVSKTLTTAVLDGNEYVLNGTKHFISNAGVAETYSIFASTDKSAGLKGLSCFIVEKGTPGFSFGSHHNKMGMRGAVAGELIFEDCRIPAENLVAGLGKGNAILMNGIFSSRPSVAAQGVGLAQGALDAALSYAKTREQFGAPIIRHQAIQWKLADMYVDIDAGRGLLYKAARSLDENKKTWMMDATVAKLYCTEMSHRVVHSALQIHGGYGYMKDFPIERLYRDQRILELYEGTSEMHRWFIAAQLSR